MSIKTESKFGVIDIGSNSVRLMMSEGGKTLYKKVKITRLSEGFSDMLTLSVEAIERTASAVSDFYSLAEENGAERIFAFATEAVRKAKNRQAFLSCVKEKCGLNVEVLSGETESEIGLIGALNGKEGGIIDIGGASTEISVYKENKIVYAKSVDIGVVRIKDVCGQQESAQEPYIASKIKEFDSVPESRFFGIGGTATSIASVMQELAVYDPDKVDGFVIKKDGLSALKSRLYKLSLEEKRNLTGLQKERAEVITGGVKELEMIMEKLNLAEITVSERDNLEGYLALKTEKK